MSDQERTTDARRKFLKLMGGGAVLLPIAGLGACSGGEESAPASGGTASEAPSEPEPQQMTEEASAEPAASEGANETGGDMPRLSEDNPQAQSLGYVHDATTVDTSKYPRYQSGQACSNCALYQGDADSEWGGCSIFPGKLVKATGWCNVYAPKAG